MHAVVAPQLSAAPAHRVARTVVTVTDAEGRPVPDAEVTVAQSRHAFGFGNIAFDLIPLANGEGEVRDVGFGGASAHLERLADLWLDVFNIGTLPFYWRTFEPERGAPDTARLLQTARWLVERGVTVKGHPLVWHTLTPSWLDDVPLDKLASVIRSRIVREVSDFAGVIDTWDAINEVVIMPVFEAEPNAVTRLAARDGQIAMVKLAFETAREANPNATLLLNDFNMSPAYERLVEECLEAGVQIDALGLQSHMHQGYWGEEKTLDVLERFSRFGLPLHLTETTLLSGHLMPPEIVDLNDYQIPDWPSTPEGEARQADEVERHHRTLFGHPAVQASTYWGLTDDGAWLGAPGGFVRADGTPKPAYDALRRLVKEEWWTPETAVRTDAEGRFALEGFLGEYAVTSADGAASLTLAADGAAVEAGLG